MKRITISIFSVLLLTLMATSAWAQCEEEYTVFIGTSECIQVCAFQPVNINLQGTRPGEVSTPILSLAAGCQIPGRCATECNPIAPPPYPFIWNGDPWAPGEYFSANDCYEVHMRWVHDSYWVIEIFPMCNGCFCLTFERQFSVNLTSFMALPGNGQVELNWVTASESNNDHFEVLRDHVMVADVPALNQATGGNYSWIDHLVTNGQDYSYTLVSVDMNGVREELQTISGVRPSAQPMPTAYALYQNFPNPFNPETSIAFDLVQDGSVDLAIYSVLGEKVSTLVSGRMSSGHHAVVFNGSNLPTGVYLYKLTANGFTDTKKLVLLK